jgi:type IV pilus assembly protein PilX
MTGKIEGDSLQDGAVLIFCLIFLLVLTMMSASSMESSILEEKISGSMLDYSKAFHAAEAALRAGETSLSGLNLRPDGSIDGGTGIWQKNAMDPDLLNSISWWSEPARNNADWWTGTAFVLAEFTGPVVVPAYTIEAYASAFLPALETDEELVERALYRVTARGTGGQDSTIVHLQSIFAMTISIDSIESAGRQSWRQLE